MNKNFKFWKDIWDSKGNSNSSDLLFLDGYEHLNQDFSSAKIVNDIISTLSIDRSDKVLEVACGCGFLSREFHKYCYYVGVDYSEPIIKKHEEMFKHQVYVCEANDLFFEEAEFDYVFCYGLFQYLPNIEYADRVLSEMQRVCKKGIFLGDLKNKKTRNTHFVYPKEKLTKQDYKFTKCIYNPKDNTRYNAYKPKEIK